MKKRFLSAVLTLCMIFGLFLASAAPAHAATAGHTRDEAVAWILAQENTARDYDGAYGAQCVDLIYFYYGYLGQASRGGNASYYMWNDLPTGWSRLTSAQTTPEPGDIVVFDAGYYQTTIAWTTGWTGHVGLVYDVDGSNYYYLDYNGWSPNNRLTSGQKRTAQIHDFSCVIRPDWPTASPPAQNSERVCDLGSEFYGRISYNGGWLHTTGEPIQDGEGYGVDVRVTKNSNLADRSQIWHFIKKDNGYKIVNMGSGWCLDVRTGRAGDKGNVWTWYDDHGDVPERWYFVAAQGKTGYRLVTAIDSRYCLDIPGGDVYEGANAEIYTRNDNSWQFFTITEIRDYSGNPGPDKTEPVPVVTPPATDTDPCAKGHSWGGWKVLIASTCTQPGRRVRTCSVCGEQDSETVAKTGHDWQPAGVGYSVCTRCGDVLNTGSLIPDGNDGFVVAPNTPDPAPSGGADTAPDTGNTGYDTNSFENFQRINAYYDGLFRDVPAGAWYAKNVKISYEMGLIRGRSAGQFAPESNMTIAEAITLAARIHSIYTCGKEFFATYDGGNWFDPYVDYAREKGVCTENYSYNRPATRDEFVHILAQALPGEALARTKGASSFADARDIIHSGDIEQLYQAGVIGGVDEGGLTLFKPNQTVTRAEAAAIITRMVRKDMRL